MTLYNLKTDGQNYRITKFDDDLNVESSYLLGENIPTGCECPGAQRTICRHQKMLPLMYDRRDSHWFFDYDRQTWIEGQRQEETGTVIYETPGDGTFEAVEYQGFESPPEGVTALGLDDPEALHNVVAEAVGEPPLNAQPTPTPVISGKVRRI